MAQRPKGSGKGPSKGPAKGPEKDKGKSLHAPLEMKNRTHKEHKMSAAEASEGVRRAQAELARRAKKSAFSRYAPLAAMPVLIVLLLGTYAYLWFSAASSLKDFAETLQITQDGDGWQVSGENPNVGGFPMKVGVTVGKVEIKAPERWGGWVWRADQLQFSADAWQPSKPSLQPVGHSQLRTANGTLYDLSGDVAQLTLDLGSNDQIRGITLTFKNATAQPVGGAPPLQIADLVLTADRLPLPVSPPADSHTATYKMALTLSDTVVPQEMAPSIGPMIRQMELSGRLLGPVGEGSLREQLTKWRDDGGVAEIDRFYIDWSPLKLAATGTLALDDRMQPVGALSSQIQGFFETVDTLYQARIMRARDATLARVVLGTMAENKGGVPTLTTPVSLQSGKLILGPVTVMETPTINWPGPASPRVLPSLQPSYQVDRWGRIIRQE